MKDFQHRVTALVPSYNHGRYIRERIESIVNQTYPNIDLIVIDDCSTDDSHSIISELQTKYCFQYLRNEKNSGSPFSAWERICSLSSSDFIWVCESDDVAEATFVETAVSNLVADKNSVMFYCSSIIIDEDSNIIGNTDSFFHDIWKEVRWDKGFVVDGITELIQFQLRGQTVPNMSSALFTTNAFRAAFTPFLKQLRLTGDWLFVGDIMKQGKVIFKPTALNRFRKHEITSRVRVKSARSQAEFMLTKYHLFRKSGQPINEFATLVGTDVVRFLYASASWLDVGKELLKVSFFDTVKFSCLLMISLARNTNYIRNFHERYKHAKEWRMREQTDQD